MASSVEKEAQDLIERPRSRALGVKVAVALLCAGGALVALTKPERASGLLRGGSTMLYGYSGYGSGNQEYNYPGGSTQIMADGTVQVKYPGGMVTTGPSGTQVMGPGGGVNTGQGGTSFTGPSTSVGGGGVGFVPSLPTPGIPAVGICSGTCDNCLMGGSICGPNTAAGCDQTEVSDAAQITCDCGGCKQSGASATGGIMCNGGDCLQDSTKAGAMLSCNKGGCTQTDAKASGLVSCDAGGCNQDKASAPLISCNGGGCQGQSGALGNLVTCNGGGCS